METNYVLVMGLFLLLVSVDCSSSDPKGHENEKTSLHQNVDGTVNPVKGKVDSSSVSDSIEVSSVKDNGANQIDGSEGGVGSDTSKSNLKQQSGSNEDHDLQKDGKDSRAGANGKTDGEGKGDNQHKNQDESKVVEEKGKSYDQEKGDNKHEDQNGSRVEERGRTDSVEKGDVEHQNQDTLKVEQKRETNGEGKGNKEHKDPVESKIEEKGNRDGEKKGDIEHKNQDKLKVGEKGKMDGEGKGINKHEDQDEPKVERKKKTDDEKKGNQDDSVDPKDDEKKGNQDDSVDPKEIKKEKVDARDSVLPPPPPTWTDNIHGEECDPSNMCMDKNKRFAACLRVPGNESPELSLLIQNKGKGPLAIKISGPAFLQLEKTDVELQEKENKKVKVTIKNSGTENLIVLKDGSGECSLDFKDAIAHNSGKSYVNFLSQTPTTTLMFVAAVLMLASGWICVSFRRRLIKRTGLKYQRLDMALPISSGAKKVPDVNNGWDNNWSDNWDDEEAPMTSSMPVTPSVSSKGLASRRWSKEGWKD